MNRHSILVLTVLVCAPLAAEDLPASVTLRGRVIDAQTGESIAKARVSIRDRKVEAITDAGGRFVLTGVPPGEAEIDTRTGRVVLENDTLFPFLPSAGVTVES